MFYVALGVNRNTSVAVVSFSLWSPHFEFQGYRHVAEPNFHQSPVPQTQISQLLKDKI